MAGVGDLGCQVQIVLPLLLGPIIRADAHHAPGEAGQVAHLVVQDPPSPLGQVGQTSRGFLHQVGLYSLQKGEAKRGQ